MVCGRGGESGSDRGGSSGLGALVAASTVATVATLIDASWMYSSQYRCS